MRIAFIVSRRDPAIPLIDNDGGVVLLMGYGSSLVELGHEVTVFTPRINDGWGIKEYVELKRAAQKEDVVVLQEGIKVVRKDVAPIQISDTSDLNSDQHVVKSALLFADAFGDHELDDFDVINFSHPTSAYGFLFQKKVIEKKTFLFPMLLSTEYVKFKQLTSDYFAMEKLVLDSIGTVLSSSDDEMSQLATLGVESQKIRLLARGFNTNFFFYKYRMLPQNDEPIKLVSVGAIRAQKNQTMLVALARELKRSAVNATITVVGDNQNFSYEKNKMYYDEIVETIASEGLSDVIQFVGGKSPSDLAAILHDAHVGIFPSFAESFGKAALESIATGLPTIASDGVEAYKIFMNDSNALMVEPTVEAYSSALDRLIRDPELYARLSKNGEALSVNFSWEAVTKQLESIYLERIS